MSAEEQRLQALAALNVLDTPAEERFDRIVRLAQRMFGASNAHVTLIDEDRQFIKASATEVERNVPRHESFCTHTVQHAGPMVVADPEHDDRFRDNPSVTMDGGIRFYAGQPLRTPTGVAVGALCVVDTETREISQDQLDMLRDLADLVETELARTDEVDRASEVQRSMLPRSTPDLPGYELAAVCVPAAAVGGDFYDWAPVADGVQIVMADVMGKGMPAAIIGAGARALLRASARFNDLESTIYRVANSMLADLEEAATFITVFAARLDPARHVLSYIDAGHGLAGVVHSDGTLQVLASDGLPFGVPALDLWESKSVRLEKGDTFVCVSDGLLDVFGTLDEAREAARRLVVRSESVQEVVDRSAAYGRSHLASDDITVIALRRTE